MKIKATSIILILLCSLSHAGENTITQGEWARRLVKALGLEKEGIPEEARVEDYISLLEGGKSIKFEVSSPQKNLSTLNLNLSVEHSGVYNLLVDTNAQTLIIGIDDNVRLAKHSSERDGYLNIGRYVLKRGPHSFSAVLKNGESLRSVYLSAPCLPKVAPHGGWVPEKTLTFLDKAVTIIKALNMEDRLPMEESYALKLEQYERTTFVAPKNGVYSIYVQVGGVVDSSWDIDGCWFVPLISGMNNNIPIWREVSTLPLTRGSHVIKIKMNKGRLNNRLLIVKRDTADSNYMNLLRKLNPIEGAGHENVSEEAAVANLIHPVFAARSKKGPEVLFYIEEEEFPRMPSEKEAPPYTVPVSPVLPPGI